MEKLTKEQKLYVDLKKTAVTTSQGLKDIFYKVPKIFWLGELYKDMSLEAKIAYGILEDRKSVSLKNKWYDDENKIYFIYKIEDLQKELGVSKATAIKIKKELLAYGLLSQKKSEPNKPARLYLYNPVATEEDEKKYVLRYATSQNITEETGTETPSKKTDSDEFTNSKQETDKVENGGLKFKLPDNKKKNGGLKFKLPKVQNLNPSKTNVSNINNYISNDSYDSELKFDRRLLNYKQQGVPDKITQMLTIGKGNYQECSQRMGLLFKAKSSVHKEVSSQGLNGLILFEDFTEEDWEELYQVLHLCFVKIKEGLIKNEEKYIFISLKAFFEKYINNLLYIRSKSMEG
jgi:replication initiator protein A N-terminal domain protein